MTTKLIKIKNNKTEILQCSINKSDVLKRINDDIEKCGYLGVKLYRHPRHGDRTIFSTGYANLQYILYE